MGDNGTWQYREKISSGFTRIRFRTWRNVSSLFIIVSGSWIQKTGVKWRTWDYFSEGDFFILILSIVSASFHTMKWRDLIYETYVRTIFVRYYILNSLCTASCYVYDSLIPMHSTQDFLVYLKEVHYYALMLHIWR